MRCVHHQAPARLRDARELAREGGLVRRVLEHVHHRHLSKAASANGSRAASTRCTSLSTSERIEATASGVRSPEAHEPPRSRSSRLTTPLSEPRSRQRRASVGPSARTSSAELALLQDRAPVERERPLPRCPWLSHGARASAPRGTRAPASGRARPPRPRRRARRRPSRARGRAPSGARTAAGGPSRGSRSPRTRLRARDRRRPERTRVALDALLEPEQRARERVDAAPGRVVDDHGRACEPRERREQRVHLPYVRQEPQRHNEVERALRQTGVQQVGGDEASPTSARPLAGRAPRRRGRSRGRSRRIRPRRAGR